MYPAAYLVSQHVGRSHAAKLAARVQAEEEQTEPRLNRLHTLLLNEFLRRVMGRQVVVKYAPLHSSLVNLPLSLYGPLVSDGVVRNGPLPSLGDSTNITLPRDLNPSPFICPMASRETDSSLRT